jgi:hypothetical protein
VRRYLRSEPTSRRSSATRFSAFAGGCVTERFTAPARQTQLLNEGSSALGFITRQEFGQVLNQRSGGRFQRV